MKSKIILAMLAISSLLLALSAWAQDSAPPPASGPPFAQDATAGEEPPEETPAGQTAPPRPLSGVQTQAGGAAVSSRQGVVIPSFMLSQMAILGSGNTDYQTGISGGLLYNQASAHHSFSLQYYGGGFFDDRNSASDSSFHELSVMPSFTVGRWTLLFGDTLAYLPYAPIGAGMGIPGLGQFTPGMFGNLNPNLLPSQSILTYAMRSLNNSSFGQAQYNFTRQTSLTAVASYGLLDFLDDSVLNNYQETFSAGLNHQMGRSQAAVQYAYSRFGYDAFSGGLETDTAQLMYSRTLRHDFIAQIGAGPEIVRPFGSFGNRSSVVGSGLAGLTYTRQRNSLALQYFRGVTGGSGLMVGALTDTVQLAAGHQSRVWGFSANGSYMLNSGILENEKAIGRTVGAQVTRSLSRTMGVYWNYTYFIQDAVNVCFAPGACAFNGDEHVFGIGFNWQPRGWRVGQ